MKTITAGLCLMASSAALGAAPASAATFVYGGAGGNLPDRVNFSRSITVADDFVIEDVNLRLNNLRHTFFADLVISLSKIDSGTVLLADTNGGSSNPNGNFTFDDEASRSVTGVNTAGGSFRPLQSLSAFDGGNAAGTWRLNIRDQFGFDSGRLGSWTLTVTGAETGAVPEPATWAMLMLGFFAIGGAMRSRQRKQSVRVAYS